jgi:hypothetical protein
MQEKLTKNCKSIELTQKRCRKTRFLGKFTMKMRKQQASLHPVRMHDVQFWKNTARAADKKSP